MGREGKTTILQVTAAHQAADVSRRGRSMELLIADRTYVQQKCTGCRKSYKHHINALAGTSFILMILPHPALHSPVARCLTAALHPTQAANSWDKCPHILLPLFNNTSSSSVSLLDLKLCCFRPCWHRSCSIQGSRGTVHQQQYYCCCRQGSHCLGPGFFTPSSQEGLCCLCPPVSAYDQAASGPPFRCRKLQGIQPPGCSWLARSCMSCDGASSNTLASCCRLLHSSRSLQMATLSSNTLVLALARVWPLAPV